MGWRGWAVRAYTHKKELTLRKRHFFVIETYIEDVKQDEKHVADLLEAIMRPFFFTKDELRPILFRITQIMSKITNIKSKITKIKVSIFLIPEFRSFRTAGQYEPSHK